MSSTNKTTTLDLSQFTGTDKPDWLTDYNDDMEKIDTFATVAQSDIETANTDAATAKNTAAAASTAANQASATAGSALTAVNNTNANIANWKGSDAFAADASWNVSNTLSFKYNKTLGLLNFSAFLSSSTTIQKGRVICTLPAECRPTKTISIRAGAFVRASSGITSNCTLSLTSAGVLSVNTIISTDVSANDLYINVTLATAGWGNNWPALNPV